LARSWVRPHLTRRRYPQRQDCWHVYYSDVQIGTIARRTGRPVDDEQFGWHSGFYPGIKPGQNRSSTAIDFDHARADFEAAWQRVLPTLTGANFQEWRDQRDWIAKKYAMWERGEMFPSQRPNSMMGCPCGARFDS
jgi:hypothetical protein